MFALLGFGELGLLLAFQHGAQVSVDVLADVAAERMAEPGESWQAGWNEIVVDEEQRSSCRDAVTSVTFPDGTHGPGDRVRVDMTCRYEPRITRGLWEGLAVNVQGESVVRSSGSVFRGPS